MSVVPEIKIDWLITANKNDSSRTRTTASAIRYYQLSEYYDTVSNLYALTTRRVVVDTDESV